MLPDKNREEWRHLVAGEQKFTLKNFVLQMKVTQTAKDIKNGRLTIDKAVEDIYSLCKKYDKAVSEDIDTIFNS